MKLTTQTDYALRTLMYLASRTSRAKVADVASLFGISINHVAKAVNLLSRLGYIRSVRGIGGGIDLCVSKVRTEFVNILHSDFWVAPNQDVELLKLFDEYCRERYMNRTEGMRSAIREMVMKK